MPYSTVFRRFGKGALLFVAACSFRIEHATAASSLGDALTTGTPLVDMRLRFETVDQANKPSVADATTFRGRLGYQTNEFLGLSTLLEFDVVQHFGARRFNDSISGPASYPTIADPDMATLNRLELDYGFRLLDPAADDIQPDFRIRAGRQRIVLGDGRYIGNADWRQHEQTYDALTLSEVRQSLTVSYVYVSRVNRVFGPNSLSGNFDSDSHLFNAAYSGLPSLNLEGFTYLLDLRQAPGLSTATYGLRAKKSADLGSGVIVRVTGGYANQIGYADNPSHVVLSNSLIEAGVEYRGLTALSGYEVFQGNGEVAFQTPLANLHAFQGWAETFLIKPPNGLSDFYIKTGYGVPATPYFYRVSLALTYHSLSAEHITANYGTEWDMQLEAQVDTHVFLDAALASYAGTTSFPDKNVFWLYATYRR